MVREGVEVEAVAKWSNQSLKCWNWSEERVEHDGSKRGETEAEVQKTRRGD